MQQEKMTTTLPDGRTIEYEDCIYHTTYVRLSFMDRIRCLLKGKLQIQSEIYTSETSNVKGSTATTHVDKLFNSYRKRFSVMKSQSFENVVDGRKR